MPDLDAILKQSVAGDYVTCGMKKPFHVEERDGDIHCFVGFRNKWANFEEEANVVFWEKERVLKEAVAFIERTGEVKLGPVRQESFPDPDTLEEFLRTFSTAGNLASYFPPLLEKLGLCEVYKKVRTLYIKMKAPTQA